MQGRCATLNEGNFDSEVLKSHELVVVEFYVDWLGVCHVMTPVINSLMRKFEGRVKFAAVDTDKYPRLSMAYDVFSFPTYIVFKGGEAVKRMSGLMSTKEFAEKLETLLDS